MNAQQLIKEAEDHMAKSLDAAKRELSGVRTGKATTGILDSVRVEYYGTAMPLKQLANMSAPEPRLLTVTPFDKGAAAAIEKAIRDAGLGLNPSSDGGTIRIPIPQLNEERRKELVKVVRGIAEEGRVAIRNVRRDIMHDLRELRDEGEVGADDEHRAEVELQKLTDDKIAELDGLLKGKEAEILEV